MKNFLLVLKDNSEDITDMSRRICDLLEKNGARVTILTNPNDETGQLIDVDDSVECIVTIGGDGTLIRAAGNTSKSKAPLIGVNLGHLGYLCDLDETNLMDGLLNILDDNFNIEERMMLSGKVDENNSFSALNDIVIHSSHAGLNVINLTVYVNGSYLYSYNCDGLIFSTPTGSTAYNLSANGPIVNPKTSLILLTPINPHTLNQRSIVLDKEDSIEVTFESRTDNRDEMAEVSFDGGKKQYLKEGQRLYINRSSETTSMIHFNEKSFLRRIREKLQEI